MTYERPRLSRHAIVKSRKITVLDYIKFVFSSDVQSPLQFLGIHHQFVILRADPDLWGADIRCSGFLAKTNAKTKELGPFRGLGCLLDPPMLLTLISWITSEISNPVVGGSSYRRLVHHSLIHEVVLVRCQQRYK